MLLLVFSYLGLLVGGVDFVGLIFFLASRVSKGSQLNRPPYHMATSNPTPWNFSNKAKSLFSPDGRYRLEYSELSEIAMGGPLGGKCFLVYPDNSKLKVHDWTGGPAVWETGGRRVALPVWTMSRNQRLAVADLQARTLTIYSQKFRVLNHRPLTKVAL